MVINTVEGIKINYGIERSVCDSKKQLVHIHMNNMVKSYTYTPGCELMFALRSCIACALIWHGVSNLIN